MIFTTSRVGVTARAVPYAAAATRAAVTAACSRGRLRRGTRVGLGCRGGRLCGTRLRGSRQVVGGSWEHGAHGRLTRGVAFHQHTCCLEGTLSHKGSAPEANALRVGSAGTLDGVPQPSEAENAFLQATSAAELRSGRTTQRATLQCHAISTRTTRQGCVSVRQEVARAPGARTRARGKRIVRYSAQQSECRLGARSCNFILRFDKWKNLRHRTCKYRTFAKSSASWIITIVANTRIITKSCKQLRGQLHHDVAAKQSTRSRARGGAYGSTTTIPHAHPSVVTVRHQLSNVVSTEHHSQSAAWPANQRVQALCPMCTACSTMTPTPAPT